MIATPEISMALALGLLRDGGAGIDAIKAAHGHRVAIAAFETYLRLRDGPIERARSVRALAEAMGDGGSLR